MPANKPPGGSESQTNLAWSEGLTKSGADLSVADAEPFVAGQFVQAHRAARADFVRADADFRAHAELAAVGEARAGVPIHCRRIHLGEKLPRVFVVTMLSECAEP